ncbi:MULTISPECIES: glycoside hydrolase domain-containing protein [Fructobacillus]|uniref:Peptidoglycan-binding (PGRP) domain of peptidoglycan hydrolases (PGRP) n=1 Tax=Fructobacillus tropaeoli TaxID=709323 RepID=A0ABN9Z3Q4_9LACO|nr:Peptidoglycan-binding (PGRP) domain of peptidoglycan hydrolases (PGRP) [Fructobacillus sp. LMG 32999]CAK1254504.1 Peptidoglycan-binding (PGRP) domain of peptidoglycan hydrolases (PGRP) [Fructobacillus tropaeoli]
MDYQVLATQKWLNNTYGKVPNFNTIDENGKTGWPTIYALIKGLQYELGIPLSSDRAAAFGEETGQLFDSKIVPLLTPGYTGNIVYLIQGAFWAKGFSPEAFDGEYSEKTVTAIKLLQQAAGISTDGKMTSSLASALFDMSAFALVPGGDANIRYMQQQLNQKYQDITGILPTDGIYQRATNQALIYGAQVELQLSQVANGYWGPATSSNYRTAYFNGLSTNLMLIVQYALYVNMKEFDQEKGLVQVSFTGTLDDATVQNLQAFQAFMHLSPKVDGEPDYITMNSLMSSAGNTNRYYFGADTSTQLTGDQVQALVNDDVNYVGRYLTGTVGVGANKMAKNLTRPEAQLIIQAGLHLVPIYQDNTGDVSDYTFNSGLHDGSAAVRAALALGIPDGHTIYFAVDTDMTEDENNDYAIPYFQGVAQAMESYQIGVYGTRNTCSMVSKAVPSVKYAYVSNMSTGYSGNLGFSQPLNWAFDQFDEVGPEGNLPGRDKVAVSHADEGVTNLVASRQPKNWIESSDWQVMKKLMASHQIELNGNPYILVDDPSMKVSLSYKNVTTLNTDSVISLSYPIKNGKIDSGISSALSFGGFHLGSDLTQMFNQFTVGLESGYVTINVEQEKGSSYETAVSIEISDKELRKQSDDVTNEDVIVLDIELNWNKMQGQLTEVAFNTANVMIKNASQSMVTLLAGSLNSFGQAMFAFISVITAVLNDIGQLPNNSTIDNVVKEDADIFTVFLVVIVVVAVLA